MKVAVVIGTRPEVIKMASVVLELQKRNVQHVVIATAQHREMLDQHLGLLTTAPHYDLNIMQKNQDVFYVTTSVLNEMKPVLIKEKPDILLLQGDTTTTFAASLAAFYLGIPVGHVEAGLRTWNKSNPFPEEINRQLTSRLTDFHFAPTEWARKNLLSEGIPPGTIFVTGNTVIDSLLLTAKENYQFTNQKLQELDFNNKKVMLLTSHRRENFGDPMREVFLACREIVKKNPDVELVYPVHPNPNVQKAAHEIFGNVPRVHLVEPLDYRQFVHLMKRCYLILTDSGGVQEEAPSLGKPVLVLRSTTERPEAIEAGTAMLVGTSGETIVKQTQSLLDDKAVYARMASNVNPYGDGKAGERIVNIVLNALSTER